MLTSNKDGTSIFDDRHKLAALLESEMKNYQEEIVAMQ